MSKARFTSPSPSRLNAATGSRAVAAILLTSLCFATACKKDEPPPPLPEPKAVTAPDEPLELKPEDAGMPAVEEAPKAKSARPRSVGLSQCCKALRQNAANAPEPTKGYMNYAAQLCDGAVAQGQGQSTAIGMIRAALKGAGMPADCK